MTPEKLELKNNSQNLLSSLYISLVICTYQRPESLKSLLLSLRKLIRKPNEVLIIDGSNDLLTKEIIDADFYEEVLYFRVSKNNKGLTRQRNYGIGQTSDQSDIVAFVDDDTVLEADYFQVIEETFLKNPDIGGIGGVAINENQWRKIDGNVNLDSRNYYQLDGFYIKETSRTKIRKILCLDSPLPPFQMPDFSHVRASGFPPTDKFYEVDLLVGMSFAFRKFIVSRQKFSLFFDGYGLYEDADYSIRALRFGKNVMHTGVKLSHFHHPSGRPNYYKYGKMVIRNGFYVWRLKYPEPSLKAKIKWHATAFLLTLLRGGNTITGPHRTQALQEFSGRVAGWFSLVLGEKPIPRMD